MRARLAAVLTLILLCFTVAVPVAHAGGLTLSQETDTEGVVGEEEESQQGEAGNQEEGTGQGDADAETGAGAGEQEAAAEEEGPPWTYQMARIGIGLMVIIGVLMGLLYYRMIASRQRSA